MADSKRDTEALPLHEALDLFVDAALTRFIGALEHRPDLAARLARALLGQGRTTSSATRANFMSVAEYAAHRRVCERTVRYDLKKMIEGVHYEHAGRKGRRVVIRVSAADQWHAERIRERPAAVSIEELAIDEVTRRRAQVALRKRKENT